MVVLSYDHLVLWLSCFVVVLSCGWVVLWLGCHVAVLPCLVLSCLVRFCLVVYLVLSCLVAVLPYLLDNNCDNTITTQLLSKRVIKSEALDALGFHCVSWFPIVQ